MFDLALLDLFMLARTKHFVGTRFSTFSFLVAGMHASSTHYMVYPGVYERCVRATSPYSSLNQVCAAYVRAHVQGRVIVCACMSH